MSNPIQPSAIPTSDFPSHVGSSSNSSDLAAECQEWKKRCGELLAERQTLRQELAKIQGECKSYRKSLVHLLKGDFTADFDMELAFAHLDDKPSIEELIADLEHAPGK